MNYLAHALLSGACTKVLVGNLMGDFVKGPLTQTADRTIRHGVWLHRRIDSYTDAHPLPRRSRRRISAGRRRFAGIIIDVAYDHFLAANWSRFCPLAMSEFIAGTYAVLQRHEQHLPLRMRAVLPRMVREDWFGSYRTLDGLDGVLNRLARRLSRDNTLGGGAAEVTAHYAALQADFLAFFPQLAAFARHQAAMLPPAGGRTAPLAPQPAGTRP